MPFLTIAGTTVPITRPGTADMAPDGQGRRKWTFVSAPVPDATLATLTAAIGIPSGAESVRAWDGTLLTDRPLVSIGGSAMGGGTVACEVTITGAAYHHHKASGDSACFYRVLSLTFREG